MQWRKYTATLSSPPATNSIALIPLVVTAAVKLAAEEALVLKVLMVSVKAKTLLGAGHHFPWLIATSTHARLGEKAH